MAHDLGIRRSAGRLISLLGQERTDLMALLVYSVFAGLLSLSFPLTAQVLINTVAAGAVMQNLTVLSFALLGGLLLYTWLETARFTLIEFIGRRVFVRRARSFSERLAFADDEITKRHTRLSLANRFFDVITIDKSLQVLLVDGVSSLLAVVVGMLLLAVYHPALLVFDLLLTVAILIPFVWTNLGVRTAYEESTAKYFLVDWLESLAVSSTWPREARGHAQTMTTTEALVDDWLVARGAQFRVTRRQYVSTLLTQALGMAGVLALGGWLIVNEQLSVGQLVAAELVVSATVAGLARIGKLWPKAYDLLVALEKVESVDEELPQERHGGGILPHRAGLRVDVCDVRTSTTEPPLSLSALPGALVALPPNVQSHTLLRILYGLARPSAGSVLFDNIPLSDLRLASLRDDVVVIDPDETVAGTIKSQFLIDGKEVNAADIWAAIDDVGLGARLRSRHLDLGVDVVALSRVERLLVVIARARFRRPRLWLVQGLGLFSPHEWAQVSTAMAKDGATRIVVGAAHTPVPPDADDASRENDEVTS